MTNTAMLYTGIVILALIATIVIPATATSGLIVTTPVEEDEGTGLLDGMGISVADRQSLKQQAKDLQARAQSTSGPQTAATNAAGTYLENSMEKIITTDGTVFEGGTTTNFVISTDNQVTGTVDFKFIEQGWTITIKGTVTGFLTPATGKLVIHSNDAYLKYAGKQYPIVMEVEAQYNGTSFDGTKDLTMAGTSGTLGFHAEPVV